MNLPEASRRQSSALLVSGRAATAETPRRPHRTRPWHHGPT